MSPGRLDGGAAQAFAVTYLLAQSAGVVAFWLVIGLVPRASELFVPASWAEGALWVLLPAEALLCVSGVVAAVGVGRSAPWCRSALWLHAGAAVYAGATAVGMFIADVRVWAGVGLMVPVMVVPLHLALAAGTRRGGEGRTSGHTLMLTLAQTALFWLFFLVVVPACLANVESRLELATPALGGAAPRGVGAAVFVVAGAGGLWSGWALAVLGRGTPLPTDPPAAFVATGPYRFIRNPMALSGIAQGLGVGLWIGSWLVIAYALIGAVLWHVVVRPIEERELEARFGEPYARYRRRCRCWLPCRPGPTSGQASRGG